MFDKLLEAETSATISFEVKITTTNKTRLSFEIYATTWNLPFAKDRVIMPITLCIQCTCSWGGQPAHYNVVTVSSYTTARSKAPEALWLGHPTHTAALSELFNSFFSVDCHWSPGCWSPGCRAAQSLICAIGTLCWRHVMVNRGVTSLYSPTRCRSSAVVRSLTFVQSKSGYCFAYSGPCRCRKSCEISDFILICWKYFDQSYSQLSREWRYTECRQGWCL